MVYMKNFSDVRFLVLVISLLASPIIASNEAEKIETMAFFAANMQIALLTAPTNQIQSIMLAKSAFQERCNSQDVLISYVSQYIREVEQKALSEQTINMLSCVPIERLVAAYPLASEQSKNS